MWQLPPKSSTDSTERRAAFRMQHHLGRLPSHGMCLKKKPCPSSNCQKNHCCRRGSTGYTNFHICWDIWYFFGGANVRGKGLVSEITAKPISMRKWAWAMTCTYCTYMCLYNIYIYIYNAFQKTYLLFTWIIASNKKCCSMSIIIENHVKW